MIGTLIETEARVPRRAMGMAVSFMAHTALVALAVATTAAKHVSATKPLLIAVRPIMAPPPRPNKDAGLSAARRPETNVATPLMPAIQVPMITPTDIPAIDFSPAATAVDFLSSTSRVGNPCADQCPQLNGRGSDSTSAVWAVNEAMMQLREPAIPPKYPDALRRAGIDGTVVVKFVVDTLGRVDPATIEVLSSTHSQFTAAVRATIDRLRFYPATAAGRRVRAAAVMPFQFTLK